VAVVQYTFTHKQYTERHKKTIYRTTKENLEECGLCPIFAGYTLVLALQLRKKYGKTSVRVAEEVPAGTMNIHKHTIAEYTASQSRLCHEKIKYPTKKNCRLRSPPPKYSCPENV